VSRSATDVLRGGFDTTVRNWQVLLFRIAEHLAMVAISVAAIIAIIVPIFVGIGLGRIDLGAPPDESANIIVAALLEHWKLLGFILLVITAVLGVFVVIHSFVQAGATEVYAADSFTSERFLRGAKRGWLPVFWIYNLAWVVAGVVILIPIAPIPLIIIASQGATGAIVAGCALLVLWAFFAAIVALLTVAWTTKATAIVMTRGVTARESLRDARKEIRASFGLHFAVAFVMMVIWLGGSGVIGSISTILMAGHASPLAIVTAPAHLLLSVVQGIFSAGVESWFLASYIKLSEH